MLCFAKNVNYFLFEGAKEEAEDLDIEWEDVATGAKTPIGQVRGKGSPKKRSQQQQQLHHSMSAPNFDPESSNSTGFVNMGPGFSPFASPMKRDEMSYDWVSKKLIDFF